MLTPAWPVGTAQSDADAQLKAVLFPQLMEEGKSVGVRFDYGGKIAASQRGHALVDAAYTHGGEALQNAVVEALLHYYHEAQGNLGDAAGLRRVAVEAGVPAEVVDALLARPLREVHADVESVSERTALTYGINIGIVPCYNFNGAALWGAQEQADFSRAFGNLPSKRG